MSTWLSESDGESLADVVNPRLGLTGSTAETVMLLFSKPEPAAETADRVGR